MLDDVPRKCPWSSRMKGCGFDSCSWEEGRTTAVSIGGSSEVLEEARPGVVDFTESDARCVGGDSSSIVELFFFLRFSRRVAVKVQGWSLAGGVLGRPRVYGAVNSQRWPSKAQGPQG